MPATDERLRKLAQRLADYTHVDAMNALVDIADCTQPLPAGAGERGSASGRSRSPGPLLKVAVAGS